MQIECLKSGKKFEDIFDTATSYSNSVSTQLTMRDGELVNLPLNLIVTGDLVLLKPGQTINLNCKSLQVDTYGNYECFEIGKVYESSGDATKRQLTGASVPNFESLASLYENNKDFNIRTLVNSCKFKHIPQPILCEVTESPYLAYLK